jgi:hypothetical protein
VMGDLLELFAGAVFHGFLRHPVRLSVSQAHSMPRAPGVTVA